MPQEIFLIDNTLLSNVALGVLDDSIEREKVMNALNHTDVEYNGWDIIDQIQICESCFDSHNYDHENNSLSPDAIYSDTEQIAGRMWNYNTEYEVQR